jgi:hypothetical protein
MTKGVITSHKSEDRHYNDQRGNRLVITPLAIVLSVLRFMACYYPFGHCIVCPQIYGLLLPLWPLYCLSSDLWLVITPLIIILSVLRFLAYKSEDRQYNDQRGNNKP